MKKDDADRPDSTLGVARGAEVLVGDMPLPRQVYEELKKLGIPLMFYSKAELKMATQAMAIDGELIEDENGIFFADKLTLTDDEAGKQTHAHRSRCGAGYLYVEPENTLSREGWMDTLPCGVGILAHPGRVQELLKQPDAQIPLPVDHAIYS